MVTAVTALPLSVSGVVLVAAAAHASWNAIIHEIKDKLVAFALLGIGGAAAAGVVAAFAPLPAGAAWPYLLASVAIHIAYTLLLMQSYRLGDFSQVYPLARGISPLVVTVLAAVFASEVPSALHLVGVLVVSAGLGSLVFAGGRAGAGAGPGRLAGGRAALLAAVGTGLTIASYTVVDGFGVRLSHSAAGYTGWLMVIESLDSAAIAFVWRWARPAGTSRNVLAGQGRRVLGIGVVAGGLSVLAYGLVLWAQTRGALAPIAALRETSIIFGAVIGALMFHERFGRVRVIASVVVVAGIALISI